MPSNKNVDVKLLSDYHLKRANQELDSAIKEKNINNFESSTNRVYFCIFHAIKSILALKNIDYRSHSEVIEYFKKKYINTNRIEKKYETIINKAFELKQKLNNQESLDINLNETEELILNAESFLKRVKIYLLNKQTDTTIHIVKENEQLNEIDYNLGNEQTLSKRSEDFLSGLTGISIFVEILLQLGIAFVNVILIVECIFSHRSTSQDFYSIITLWIFEATVLIVLLIVFLKYMKKREMNKNSKDFNNIDSLKQENLTYENDKADKVFKNLYLLYWLIGWFPIYWFCIEILQGNEQRYLGGIYDLGKYVISKHGEDWFLPIYIVTCLIAIPLPWFYKLFKSIFFRIKSKE